MRNSLIAAVAAVTLGMSGAAFAGSPLYSHNDHQQQVARNSVVMPSQRPAYLARNSVVLPNQRPAYLARNSVVLPNQRPAYLARNSVVLPNQRPAYLARKKAGRRTGLFLFQAKTGLGKWMPHSVLTCPGHRPALRSAPSATGAVQVVQPTERNP